MGNLPEETLKALAPPRSSSEAVALVEQNLRGGGDAIKLFTGSWVSRERVIPMPAAIARSTVEVAHRRHKLVFSHPSNLEGVHIAIEAQVDVLAHAPDDTRGIDEDVLRSAVDRRVAMIPTLKLFSGNTYTPEIRRLVRDFHRLGGTLLFGTDTGYLTDYEVSQEFQELAKAQLDWRDLLRMLTENPARLFRQSDRGRVRPGMASDLTVLAADPATDPSAFWRVRHTIRNSKVIWSAQP